MLTLRTITSPRATPFCLPPLSSQTADLSPVLLVMGDSDESGGGRAYATFRGLVETADKKFAAVRDLAAHGRAQQHHAHSYRKVFKAYTRLWRFQQERRRELVDEGMRRWEIGEIASRIGQLYYGQYQRTSESRFLVEAYVFYEAVWSRRYFEDGKGKGKGKWNEEQQEETKKENHLRKKKSKMDLGVRGKELRFYARFIVVALLLNRMEVVRQLVEKFRFLLDDCRVSFPETNFKEWKQVLQEILRFLKADSGFPSSRPLRYNGLFDSHPSSLQYLARFHPARALKLQDAVLTGYHRNEVKYTDLTLDSFRMLQSLEWEPSGSFYQKSGPELTNNGGYSDTSGASGMIDINLAVDMIDSTLPPNPRKVILYHPSVPQLIAVTAAICEELPHDSILLIYISSSGKSYQNIALQHENSGAYENSNAGITDHCDNVNLFNHTSPSDTVDSRDLCGNYLCLGSRGSSCVNKLYPADLISFTRRPLFLIIDSDSSHAFKDIHGAERGEAVALLLSPLKPMSQGKSACDPTANGSQFTFFLTAPLQAFCRLVGLSDINPDAYSSVDSLLSTALAKWEGMLCTSGNLNQVWAQVFPDPFLRRLILRFIFCRAVLYHFHLPQKRPHHHPYCLPELPVCVSPDSSSVQSSIVLLAESLGVISHFDFTETSSIDS